MSFGRFVASRSWNARGLCTTSVSGKRVLAIGLGNIGNPLAGKSRREFKEHHSPYSVETKLKPSRDLHLLQAESLQSMIPRYSI